MDFRNYESYVGHAASRKGIQDDPNMTDFQKELSLKYVNCFGTQEAVDQYYSGGKLSPDNHLGMGRSHLVLATDLITMLLESQDKRRAGLYQRQYTTEGYDEVCHMYNFYRYKHGSMHIPKIFKTKLWVVVLLDDDEKQPRTPVLVHVLNALAYPLKFVPQRSVLNMDEYKCVTYRIGAVTRGFSIQIQIPKRFSFIES